MLNRVLLSLFTIFIFSSCGDNNAPSQIEESKNTVVEIISPEIQQIIDTANVNGVVLIYDPDEGKYYSNNFLRAGRGFLPASIFKIPNSIIALETKVVEDENTVFKWDGEKRRLKAWEQDLIFKEAFHLSCVPCYQEVARKVGPDRMKEYLEKFDYGYMAVDSASIDVFWLEGGSKISAYQQINFLKKFYNATLPVSDKTIAIMKRMMVMDENEKYKLSGKTGWAIRGAIDIGWFVGYIESKGKVYFFATNIDPRAGFDMNNFYQTRVQITMDALKALKVI